MKFSHIYTKACMFGLILTAATFSSCEKDGNPNNLPEVNPADYVGKIDGFTSTDEIYPNNLVAYWDFEGTKNEKKSGTAPTTTANDAIVDGGFKGKALSLNEGFLYYATQFNAFKTANFKDFTISTWVQIANNGSKKTMLFQLARPTMFNGNINFVLETNIAANLTDVKIHPTFTTVGGGSQDNVNANYNKTPKIGLDKWVHIALTYNSATGFFNIFANGVNCGDYSSRGLGNSLFNSWEPNEVIIGGNYNVIPGKSVSTDTSFGAMTGKIDEIRIYNRVIPDAIIKSMYSLGVAKQ